MLLDTCIVVDLLRGKEAAAAFIEGLPDVPALSVITATELLAGVRNSKERRQVDRLLSVYSMHPIDLEIASLAGSYVNQYGPSHNVDPLDALIAATAKVNDLELCTLNRKHFPMFPGLTPSY